jgi:hypothetical protein
MIRVPSPRSRGATPMNTNVIFKGSTGSSASDFRPCSDSSKFVGTRSPVCGSVPLGNGLPGNFSFTHSSSSMNCHRHNHISDEQDVGFADMESAETGQTWRTRDRATIAVVTAATMQES